MGWVNVKKALISYPGKVILINYSDDWFITGSNGSCHFDDFQCSQWCKYCQNDISVSVNVWHNIFTKNQCWLIKWTLQNIFFQENVFENDLCKAMAVLFKTPCVEKFVCIFSLSVMILAEILFPLYHVSSPCLWPCWPYIMIQSNKPK